MHRCCRRHCTNHRHKLTSFTRREEKKPFGKHRRTQHILSFDFIVCCVFYNCAALWSFSFFSIAGCFIHYFIKFLACFCVDLDVFFVFHFTQLSFVSFFFYFSFVHIFSELCRYGRRSFRCSLFKQYVLFCVQTATFLWSFRVEIVSYSCLNGNFTGNFIWFLRFSFILLGNRKIVRQVLTMMMMKL